MNFTVIIPARYASERLPGKPLQDIAGKTMIERVYRKAQLSLAARVVVATDHPAIVDEVNKFEGEVCLTSDKHESGTDRLEEVVRHLGLGDEDIVVNVQGDEPLIPPAVVNQVAENLYNNQEFHAATLSEPLQDRHALFNPNVVKVVKSLSGKALYFSRATIPWYRDTFSTSSELNEKEFSTLTLAIQRHIGIYAYRVKTLKQFVTWQMSSLEVIEKLEQLRLLENDRSIHVEQACEDVPGGVDTPEDLERIRMSFESRSDK